MALENRQETRRHMPGDAQALKGLKRKMLAAAVIYGLATLLASGLWGIHMRAENIIMIYLISVIVMMIEIQEFIWGAAYTVVCILTFNFLFTEPRFTLRVNDPNYIVTMGIFMAVSAITGLLVSRLGEQVRIARKNENRMEALLEISSGYLTLSGFENIVYYGIKSLYQAAGERCVVYVADNPGQLGTPYYIKSQFPEQGMLDNDTPAHWCYVNHTMCGANTGFYGDSGWVYLPIRNRDICLGVIGVYTDGREIDHRHMVFINTVMSQMAMAIEKERLHGGKSQGCGEERQGCGPDSPDKAIYRDFCQPFEDILKEFEGIMKGEGEGSDKAGGNTPGGDRTGRDMAGLFLGLRALANRARNIPLSFLMENRGLKADLKPTDMGAVVAQAADLYENAGRERIIWIKKPEGKVMVKADPWLLEQAISNILHNALAHTPGQGKLYLGLGLDQGYGILEISDSGSGISFQELQEKLKTASEGREGRIGRGLSVSREIISANKGSMVIKSSRYGGTSVILSLPLT